MLGKERSKLLRKGKPRARYCVLATLVILVFGVIALFLRHSVNGGSQSTVPPSSVFRRRCQVEVDESDPLAVIQEVVSSYGEEQFEDTPILSGEAIKEFGIRLLAFTSIFNAYNEVALANDTVSEYITTQTEVTTTTTETVIATTKIINTTIITIKTEANPYPQSYILWSLEKILFPWFHKVYPSIQKLQHSLEGRGYVIPTGTYHFQNCIHLIHMIRYHGSTLPIVVVYAGEDGLSKSKRNFLSKLNNVQILDIYDYIIDLQLNNKFIRAFAALMSPFEEVIVCDADVFFLSNPDTLFNDAGYLEQGALFFHDRTAFPGVSQKGDWGKANFPLPLSEIFMNGRIYNKLSDFEQDSGVLVINKKERLIGLLSVCHLATRAQEFFLKSFSGEAEMWWAGFEIAQQPYSWGSYGAGAMGELRDKDGYCCGNIMAFDRDGSALWVNGAFRGDTTYKIMTHYSYDGEWDFGPRCVATNITELSEQQLKIVSDIRALWPSDLHLD